MTTARWTAASRRASLSFVIGTLLIAACSDSEVVDAKLASRGPLYLLQSVVANADGQTSYLTALDTLESEELLTYDRSIQAPGAVRTYGPHNAGYFVLGTDASLLLQRQDIADDGAWSAGDTLSLQPYAIRQLVDPALVQFVSDSQAYLIDPSRPQVLVWNPADMTFTQSIELYELPRSGATLSFSRRSVIRGDDLIFAVGFLDEAGGGAQDGIVLVSIDTNTQALRIQPSDERCRDPGEIVLGEDDTVYVFSSYRNIFGRVVSERGGDDCVLRVNPGEDTFDPDYVGSIADAVDGAPAVAIAPSGNDHVWALVLDEEVSAFGAGTTLDQFTSKPAWQWVRLDFPSLENPVTDEQRALSSYNERYFVVNDRVYVSEAGADLSQSTLIDMTGEEPARGLSFPGQAGNLLRVR